MEGTTCPRSDCAPQGLVDPVSEYKHGEGDIAVTGGYVYRGSKFPALAGVYLRRLLQRSHLGVVRQLGNGKQKCCSIVTCVSSSFGEDESGELYVVDYGGRVQRWVE